MPGLRRQRQSDQKPGELALRFGPNGAAELRDDLIADPEAETPRVRTARRIGLEQMQELLWRDDSTAVLDPHHKEVVLRRDPNPDMTAALCGLNGIQHQVQ
jgi:hypothetical protein